MVNICAHSLSQFVEDYLPRQRPARSIRATVLHHTYRPRAQDYRGLQTIERIRDYHVHSRGWRDIAANAYAAPNRKVYNARPLSATNYAHAYISKAWNQVPDDVRALAHPDRQFFNHYAFGIETIGDFDVQSISPIPPALDTALRVLAAVHTLYNLPPDRLFLHRDLAHKSCPGRRISRDWARRELADRMASTDTSSLQVILLPADTGVPSEHPDGMRSIPVGVCAANPGRMRTIPVGVCAANPGRMRSIPVGVCAANPGRMRSIPCHPALEHGVTRCDLRPLAEALGFQVIAADLPTTGTIHISPNE